MRQTLVVGNQDQGGTAFAVEFEEQVADPLAGGAVEVAGGFVGEQHVRLRREGTGNGDPLLLAAGELARIVAQALAEADSLEQFSGALASVGAAFQLQGQHHVLQRIEAVEQLERLEYEAYMGRADARPLVLVEVAEGVPGETHLAAAGLVEPGEQAEQVDLPEPELPTIARLSPRARSRERSWRMVNLPSALPTTLLRFCALRMLALMEVPMRALLLSGCLALVLLTQQAAAQTLLVVGDSISAALGLDTSQGWVALLQKRLADEGYDYRVVNASISGDTSAGGLARLPALLAEEKPALVVIELGGNDGLRGMAPAQLQQNLASMAQKARAEGAKVLLLGIQLPPNYGPRYIEAFSRVYGAVAAQEKTALVPFFLEGVGGVQGMMQADGIHPALAAQPRLLENVWPTLKPLL